MSFGSAATRRGRRPVDEAACPCGRPATFAECCGPVLDGAPADTPEALMRSRYTAFAIGDAAHLERSWHPSTRPSDVTIDDGLQWRRLDVIAARTTGDSGTVEFRAHWRGAREKTDGALHETSRFRRVSGHWYYVDGDVR